MSRPLCQPSNSDQKLFSRSYGSDVHKIISGAMSACMFLCQCFLFRPEAPLRFADLHHREVFRLGDVNHLFLLHTNEHEVGEQKTWKHLILVDQTGQHPFEANHSAQ